MSESISPKESNVNLNLSRYVDRWAKLFFLLVQGYTVINVYSDKAKTGTNDKRPDFQRMMKDAQSGTFGYIIVYMMDRSTYRRSTCRSVCSYLYRHEYVWKAFCCTSRRSTPKTSRKTRFPYVRALAGKREIHRRVYFRR